MKKKQLSLRKLWLCLMLLVGATAIAVPGIQGLTASDEDITQISVAKIGETTYESLAAAVAAVPTDGTETTITMIANEAINVDGSAVTIAAGKNVVLDLNGFQVEGMCTTGKTSALILNSGILKIQDSSDTNKDGTGSGKLSMNAVPCWVYSEQDPGGYASNLIRNEGTLTVESGLLNNISTGSAAYAIDNYTAGKVTINGGQLITAKASAIRMFYNNGGSLTVNGGIIGGSDTYMGVQVQSGANANVTINGGTLTGSYALYATNTGGSIVISDGTFNNYVGFGSAGPNDISITGGRFDSWVGTFGSQEKFISGGIYSEEPGANLIAEGYAAVANTDPATSAAYPYAVLKTTDAELILIDREPYPVTVTSTYKKVTYRRTFTSSQKDRLQSWFVPFNYTISEDDAENFQFYKIHMIANAEEAGEVDDLNSVYVYIEKLKAGDEMRANVPYVVRPLNEMQDHDFILEDVVLNAPKTTSRMHLETNEHKYDFYGCYDELPFEEREVYWMSGGILRPSTNGKLYSYRWYIRQVPKNPDADAKANFIFVESDEGEATGINGASTASPDDVEGVYTVNGIKLDAPQKGLNIIRYKNGETKKIIIK